MDLYSSSWPFCMVQYLAMSRWWMLRWLARNPVTHTSSIQKNLTVVAAVARAAAVPGLVR